MVVHKCVSFIYDHLFNLKLNAEPFIYLGEFKKPHEKAALVLIIMKKISDCVSITAKVLLIRKHVYSFSGFVIVDLV